MMTLLILAVAVLVALVVFGTNEIRMRNRAIHSVTEEVRTYQRSVAQLKDALAQATSPQRELILRNGDRAIDHLSEITWTSPWIPDGDGGRICFFCGAVHQEPASHRSDCRHIVVSRFLEKHEAALRELQRR